MARIFTTSFHFNHQNYEAIVTITGTQGSEFIQVKILNGDLEGLLPGGLLAFEGRDCTKQLNGPRNGFVESLAKCIAAAIEEHLGMPMQKS
jgi:hypothetical protein